MFYIYFLYSSNSDRYYIGHTDNVDKRVNEHNTTDNNTYTRKHRPWELKYSFPVSLNRGDAMRIEKFIKKQKSKLFNERIISERWGFINFSHLFKK